MFRLICSHNFLFFTTTAPTSLTKYLIKKGAYLIPAPPKRPASSYAVFVKQQFEKDKTLKVSTAGAELAKKWKKYPQIKEKIEKQLASKDTGYEKLKDEYEKNFVEPFKKLTAHNLRVKELFDDKKITLIKGEGIKGVAEQVTKALQETRTLQADEKLKEKALKINEEKNAIKKKYEFPQPEYKNYRAFASKHPIPKEKKDRDTENELKEKYNASVKEWEGRVAKWLEENKYQIKVEEFVKLYKKAQEKKPKKTEYTSDSD